VRERSALTRARDLYCVIGSPVARSLSPAVHNAAFAAAGIDAEYRALAVRPGAAREALQVLARLGARGASVTIPHKLEALAAATGVTATARAVGAANTLTFEKGDIAADNTDAEGFVASLREDAGFEPHGRTATVLGAGGAARAVVYGLAQAGARVTVCARRPEQAAALQDLGGAGSVAAGDWNAPPDADLLVNATPLREGLPARPRAGQTVADLIYLPPETELLARARAAGATALGGLGMLVRQAAASWERWTGAAAPLDAMFAAARAAVTSG
jgi:shikimate dehydrogenase